jgi:hypothetical protein
MERNGDKLIFNEIEQSEAGLPDHIPVSEALLYAVRLSDEALRLMKEGIAQALAIDRKVAESGRAKISHAAYITSMEHLLAEHAPITPESSDALTRDVQEFLNGPNDES